MADTNTIGTGEPSTEPKTDDRYKGYKVTRNDPDGAGQRTEVIGEKPEKPKDDKDDKAKAEPSDKSEPSTDKPPKKDNAQKRIDTLTARNKIAKEREAELQKRIDELEKAAKPQVTKANFATEDEWLEHKLQERERAKELNGLKDKQGSVTKEVNEEADKKEWQDALQTHFPDQASLASYQQTFERAVNAGVSLPDDVHDFVMDSPVGPKVLKLILDLPFGGEEAKAVYSQIVGSRSKLRLGVLLNQLEAYVSKPTQPVAATNQPTAPRVPNSAPVGSVEPRGNPANGRMTDKDWFAKNMKRPPGQR